MDGFNRTHAKYAPSAAHRWMVCHGSVQACEAVPDYQSDYAADGEEAHALLAFALRNKIQTATEAYGAYLITEGVFTFRTDDYASRIDSVDTALDYVYSILQAYPDSEMHIETIVQIPTTRVFIWGHCDIYIHAPYHKLLFVIDFKHGAGVTIEANDNKQLKLYALGVLREIKTAPDFVDTIIIQPRAFHANGAIRKEQFSVQELLNFMTEVDAAIIECEKPDPIFRPGIETCRFCPAALTCKAREAAALKVVSENFASVKDISKPKLPDPRELPIERLAYVMANLPLLKDWITSLEKTAYAYAKSGGEIPGQKLVEAEERRHWEGEPADIAAKLMALANTTDLDKVMPRKLLTLTDATALVKSAFKEAAPRGQKRKAAEEAEKALAQLTTKKSSGNLVLVPNDDRRAAVNAAMLAFKNVPQIEGPKGNER